MSGARSNRVQGADRVADNGRTDTPASAAGGVIVSTRFARRAARHGSGWIAGLEACMLGLIPDSVLSRRRLWVMGTLVLGAFALAVVAMSGPAGGDLPSLARLSHDAKRLGLLGLVTLFVIYVFSEERRLALKEAELQQLMVREVSLRARLSELSELLEATTELARTFDLQTVLTLAARRVLPGLEADQSAILLFNNRSGRMEGVTAAGRDVEHVREARVQPGEGAAGYVFSSGETLTLESEEVRQGLARQLGLPQVPSSALCVPLRFQGTVLGVFCVTRHGGVPFTPAHGRMLLPLAEHCAAAIVKALHDRQNGAARTQAA